MYLLGSKYFFVKYRRQNSGKFVMEPLQSIYLFQCESKHASNFKIYEVLQISNDKKTELKI